MIESSCASCGTIFKGRFDRDEHQCSVIARGIPAWVFWLVVIIFLVVAASIR